MEYKYTVNPDSKNPIMLINDSIGDEGINGADFQKELLTLDSMGKDSIEIMINSPGGSVFDGLSIASAILNAKTPIITNNVGIAGSIAGVIYMTASNRKMADYALFMMHNVSGGNEKARNELNNSISLLLSKNSSLSQNQIKMLMNIETWLNADDCLKNGLCNDLDNNIAPKSQKVVFKEKNSYTDIYEYANNILKEFNMKKETPATEDVENIENGIEIEISKESKEEEKKEDMEDKTEMDEENKAKNPWAICSASVGRKDKAKFEACVMKVKKEYGIHNEMDENTFNNNIKDNNMSMKNETEEVSVIENSTTDYTNLLTEKDALIEQLQNEISRLKASQKEKEITNFIESALEVGRISDETKDTWINLCNSDFESTKEIINKLSINKQAPKFENSTNNNEAKAPTTFSEMFKFAKKNK